jgi:hypothetical protein
VLGRAAQLSNSPGDPSISERERETGVYGSSLFVEMMGPGGKRKKKEMKCNTSWTAGCCGHPASQQHFVCVHGPTVPFRTWRVTLAGWRLGGPHE